MSQMPPEMMISHPPPGRMYPTERQRGTVPLRVRPPGTLQLPTGGYPDAAEAQELDAAAGERMTARVDESRTALTVDDDGTGDVLTAPPGTGPAQPLIVTGPTPTPDRRRR